MKWAFRRFGRSRRGSAAVELAAVMIPFFMLTGGLAEITMIGFAQTSLDFAVAETSRQIRTGQAQLSGASSDDVKAQLCENMQSFMLLNCEMNLFLDVDRFDSFVDAGAVENSPIQDGQFQTGGFGYTPGVASDIVVVRAYYCWDIMTPFFEQFFANVGSQRIVVSTMMFRNEPF